MQLLWQEVVDEIDHHRKLTSVLLWSSPTWGHSTNVLAGKAGFTHNTCWGQSKLIELKTCYNYNM